MTGPRRSLFLFLRGFRYRRYLSLLDPSAKTLLDIGCSDGEFVEAARKKGFDARGTDKENDVATTTDTADIVTCFQVLEHVPDPVRAIQNLSRLYRRQLIVSVPNEPLFSVYRLGWEPEHWWAITPAALRHYLGAPSYETTMMFNRYYLAIWKK
jgi:2-polyprenyl-3-methyl-5-hydroxy-6-metoxy-1,4-benzoquinol methylase